VKAEGFLADLIWLRMTVSPVAEVLVSEAF
jgi:hypothetical protein